MHTVGDDRLVAALDAAGITFEATDSGNARILVSTGNGRTQTVYVEAETTDLGDLELRKIFSSAYMSREELPRRVIDFVLAQNCDAMFGAWTSFLEGGDVFLNFEAKLPAVLSPNTLRNVIQFVGQTADDIESTLSTVDTH